MPSKCKARSRQNVKILICSLVNRPVKLKIRSRKLEIWSFLFKIAGFALKTSKNAIISTVKRFRESKRKPRMPMSVSETLRPQRKTFRALMS